MATYIVLNKDKQGVNCGTDKLIYLDGRLNKYNLRQLAKKIIDKKLPYFKNQAVYITEYSKAQYNYSTFVYSGNLIEL